LLVLGETKDFGKIERNMLTRTKQREGGNKENPMLRGGTPEALKEFHPMSLKGGENKRPEVLIHQRNVGEKRKTSVGAMDSAWHAKVVLRKK